MASTKKRPSKKTKAARKAVEDSKLLAAKTDRDKQDGQEFKSSIVTPRTNTTPMKARPHKKRG